MTRKKFVFNSIVYTTLLALLIRLFFVEVELSEGSEGGNPLLASRYFIGIIGIAVVRYSWLFHGLGDLQVYRKYQFILFAYAAIFISILPYLTILFCSILAVFWMKDFIQNQGSIVMTEI